MTLKVRINGQMKQITGPGNSPVTFINGTKKKLVKGVTFINGVKKVLWDTKDLKIDIIDGVYDLFNGSAKVIWASNNKVILSTQSPYSRTLNISRWNIENKSNPIVENTVALGSVVGFSSIDTTDTNMVYYAVSGTQSAQQININPNTAEITASNPVSMTDTYWGRTSGGLIGNSDWLGYRLNTNTSWHIRLNSTLIASFGYTVSGTVSGAINIGNMAKRDATSYLLHTVSGTIQNINHSVSIVDSTGIIGGVNDANFCDILVDPEYDHIVCCGDDGYAVYDMTFKRINYSTPTAGRTYRLLGRIRDYYYVVVINTESTGGLQRPKLNIYDASNGSLLESRDLNLSFSNYDYDGPTVYTIPHISQTGALGFVWMPGGKAEDNQSQKLVIIQGY